MQKRAVLAGGGTALGAVQVYPLEQLMKEHGLPAYARAGGVSVGSVNTVMFAADKLPQLRALWNQVRGTSFFMRPNLCHLRKGLFTLSPLRKRMQRAVRLAELAPSIEYAAGVTDFQSALYRNISSRAMQTDDQLYDAICASAAQPIIMQGYLIDVGGGARHLCQDGGVVNVIPQLEAPERFDAVDVILCYPVTKLVDKPRKDVEHLLGNTTRGFNIMNRDVLVSDLRVLRDYPSSVKVTIYAPPEYMDEWDASYATVQRRLNEVGPYMWAHPMTPGEAIERWKSS